MNVNNIFGPIDIAISGMKSQDRNMRMLSSNVANARTTDAGNGEPYRRLQAAFKSEGKGIRGVEMGEISEDMSDFTQISDPGNPLADENGYVSMPNVNLPMEMINLNVATRIYQANVAILKRYQKIVNTTLELLR